MTNVKQWLLAAMLFALLGGCASAVPQAIREVPPDDVQIAQARRAPQAYRGKEVRWGGKIASVRNLKDETEVEIVGRRLNGDGRPRDEDISEGRFLAKVAGFLDPAVHAAGREVTVRGRLEDAAVERTIGEFRYLYPVVRAEQFYLWEPRQPPSRDYYGRYDDPFWNAWGPWGYPYWPYYRPWYHR